MKIQLEQVDLLEPWPELALRPGYREMRIILRFGPAPLGQMAARKRGGILPHTQLRRRIATEMHETVLKVLLQAALRSGGLPAELPAMPGLDSSLLRVAVQRRIAFVHELLRPRGLPSPYREWFTHEPAPPAASAQPVTVVVCTRDRPDDLMRCLSSLARLDYPAYRVMIVDNGADPLPIRALAARHGADYLRVAQPGKSIAMNAALRAAPTPWLALTDDDCLPEPHWLTELMRPTADARCACVTGLVLPARLENEAEVAFEEYGGLGRGMLPVLFGRWWFHESRRQAPPTWKIGAGANMLIHRERVLDFGGYDPDMGAGCRAGTGEDIDVFYQLLRRSCTIHYTPRAIVHHYHRATSQALRRQVVGYAAGHTAYHWRCIWRYRDLRSLLYLLWRLPKSLLYRRRLARQGRSTYPVSLINAEALAMLRGPWIYTGAKLARLARWIVGRFGAVSPPPPDLYIPGLWHGTKDARSNDLADTNPVRAA